MSEELKGTQICYGEEVLMMRIDDCIVFGNKTALQKYIQDRIEMSNERAIDYLRASGWIQEHDRELTEHTARAMSFVLTSYPPQTVWKCEECGMTLVSRVNYCPSCGARLEWE